MCKLYPCENLKGFATNRPPMVVFVLCLGMFGVALMSLAYYVNLHQHIDNTQVTDWNEFLGKVSELDFCITTTETKDAFTTVAHTTKSPADSRETTSPSLYPKNYSVLMSLNIQPTKQFVNIPHNLTYLSGTLQGRDLGLKELVADEPINITMQLPVEWNTTTDCRGSSGCKPVKVVTCVNFQAMESVFPSAKGSPETCETLNDTGIEYHAGLIGVKQNIYPHYLCQKQTHIKIEQHSFNTDLSVWLSQHDRSVINLHLMHTSYFLFVMVVMLVFYAMCRARQTSAGKIVETESRERLVGPNQI